MGFPTVYLRHVTIGWKRGYDGFCYMLRRLKVSTASLSPTANLSPVTVGSKRGYDGLNYMLCRMQLITT
jgi:hypothetical protein